MTRTIPPFAALRAFEATCRLGKQKAAADELLISTSAVSHQISGLEAFLGKVLFVRGHSTTVLTAEGRTYYDRVCEALDILSQATEETLSVVDETPLKIHMFQSLANLWFVPHLQEFTRRSPDQRVIVLSTPETVSLAGSDLDAMIVYAQTKPKYPLVDLLFHEVMVPVCAPAYLNKHGPLGTVDAILQQRLISSAVHTDEWDVWARTAGAEGVKPRPYLFFDNRANILEAAREGIGMAMDRRPFAEVQKARGVLVEPMALPYVTGWAYYFVANERSHKSQGISRLRRWLLALCEGFR